MRASSRSERASALDGIGRLLLAARKRDQLSYVGAVGTGFTDRSATALRKQLDALVIDKPALQMTKNGRKPPFATSTPFPVNISFHIADCLVAPVRNSFRSS